MGFYSIVKFPSLLKTLLIEHLSANSTLMKLVLQEIVWGCMLGQCQYQCLQNRLQNRKQ